VITDVGSVKGAVVAAARAALGGRFPAFVPGHPIAGTEKSGVEASFAELYKGQRVVLTPEADTDADAVKRVTDMWRAAGAETLIMSAAHHDEVLAATSHLPHMLAYTLVDALLKLDDRETLFALAASSFRDVSRVAASDPEMWHDICLSNRAALVKTLKHYRVQLDELLAALERGDGGYLRALFARAKQQRDALPAHDKGRSVD
jgi:prephenate dehydrogenase